MAVIQISRIQHRRGTSGELPDALADGEIGVTTDTGEVFMGAPNLPGIQSRKSYPYQNIKILTEFDVQRGLHGDVYYHGPLVGANLPAANAGVFVSCVPLFRHGVVDFATYDIGLSANNETTKIMGELAVCVHPSDPDQSTATFIPKGRLNFNDAALSALAFKVTRASGTGADNGQTWLSVKTGTALDFVLTVSGREWTNPPL